MTYTVLVLACLLTLTYASINRRFRHVQSEPGEVHSNCAHGVYQTPIHIESYLVETMVMPALELSGYNNYLPTPIHLYNNGHTVKVSCGNFTQGGLYKTPAITGGLLTNQFTMQSFHFHWATENRLGSEHVINSVRYPMEMHIVHKNVKYSSLEEALVHKDGLVVLAVLFQVQVKDNRNYAEILSKLGQVTQKGDRVPLDRSFSLAALLPRRTEEFYTYEGSLTTPPCSEAVTWFVLPDPVPISFHQMSLFRQLAVEDNFRRVQPVGQRKIFLRQPNRFMRGNLTEYSKDKVASRVFWLKL